GHKPDLGREGRDGRNVGAGRGRNRALAAPRLRPQRSGDAAQRVLSAGLCSDSGRLVEHEPRDAPPAAPARGRASLSDGTCRGAVAEAHARLDLGGAAPARPPPRPPGPCNLAAACPTPPAPPPPAGPT